MPAQLLSVSDIDTLVASSAALAAETARATAAEVLALKYDIRSGNFTAIFGYQHTITASCSVTDPVSPNNGSFYRIIISGGSVTSPSGKVYSKVGSLIERRYDNGFGWSERQMEDTQAITTLYQTDGTLYAFGDSQTAGTDYATKPYTSGGYKLEAYRWVNMLATRNGRNMTVSNLAMGGTGFGFDPSSDPYYWRTHFNRFPYLPADWSGSIVAMMGYNATWSTYTDSYFKILRGAYFAWVSRALISNWFGITHLGRTKDTTSGGAFGDTAGWATSESSTVDILTGVNEFNPFPVSALTFNNNALALSGSDYVQFTLTNQKHCALFFHTRQDGGLYNVKVNGVLVATGTTLYQQTVPTGMTAYIYPTAKWLYNLPASAVIRVEVPAGATYTVLWQAAGTPPDVSIVDRRQIIVSGPIPNDPYADKPALVTYAANKQVEAVVSTFAEIGFPVRQANAHNAFLLSDRENDDPAHTTPMGDEHIYQAFNFAGVPSGTRVPEAVNVGALFFDFLISGSAKMSPWSITSSFARFGHKDWDAAVGWGFLQNSDGSVSIDCAGFRSVALSSGGNARFSADSDGCRLNYISGDGIVTTSGGDGKLGISNTVETSTIATPTTGATLTGSASFGTELIEVNPAGTIAALTIKLESADALPLGTLKQLAFSQIVTALTVVPSAAGGGTLKGTTLSAAAVNTSVAFKKIGVKTWRRIY